MKACGYTIKQSDTNSGDINFSLEVHVVSPMGAGGNMQGKHFFPILCTNVIGGQRAKS